MENKKAPEGAYGIDYALLCDRVAENDINGLDFFGVCDRFHVLANQPVRKSLVLKMRAIGNVEPGTTLHVGTLSVTIFRSDDTSGTNAMERLFEAVPWKHGYYIVTIQIPCAERGDYTVQILDDFVLMHNFHYLVI